MAFPESLKLGHVLRNVGQFVSLPPINKRERGQTTQALTFEQARKLLASTQNDVRSRLDDWDARGRVTGAKVE